MQVAKPIVAIDDDDEIRMFVQLVLETEGYHVLAARNGAEALDLVKKDGIGLILLDMRMPVMDGWQFAEAYRKATVPHAPIVVMTAAQDARQRAEEIRAQAYLAKPFDIDELIRVVGQYAQGRAH